ncbi:hypothetical protein NQK81_01520 [Amycolatopsis roodepoortensis]|uniref:hypothetical protein n=1 Tax=Amycolatopsis roodepoortensis TaxID=700274 RepID=UPI00214AE357|nr:hypothetical protein [Amycolatopsis roodepoortensis]UUV32155.1 hypothetical protein NQK81_01520 [Amycolatopsis roodepoortensis]
MAAELDTSRHSLSKLGAAVDALFGESGGPATHLFGAIAQAFDLLRLAEDEIVQARSRHPLHNDLLHHSFSLLAPNFALERMRFEIVYRAHCRELLDRVAAGEDTRPGTAAEVCCAMYNTSLLSPLTSAATGLYIRMWQRAGLPELEELTEAGRHHEALEKSVIDDHETFARRKLAMPDRRLGAISPTTPTGSNR